MQRLIELDAERIVLEEAARVVELLGWTDDVQLYLTVATPGMWTDPVATTVGHALSNHHPGEVLLWFDDEYDRAAVPAAAAIQTMRCCWWTAVGATAPSLRTTAGRRVPGNRSTRLELMFATDGNAAGSPAVVTRYNQSALPDPEATKGCRHG